MVQIKGFLLVILLITMLVGSVAFSQELIQLHKEFRPMDISPTRPQQVEIADIPASIQSALEMGRQKFNWTRVQQNEPLLVRDWDGQPAYWKFLLRQDEKIIGFIDVDVKSGETIRFGNFGSPLQHFPDPPTAEEALEQARGFLSQYSNATFDTPFLWGPNRESWLILVWHEGKIIARVGVWGDWVWDEMKRQGVW